MEFIETTLEQNIDWNMSDCNKLEKEIQSLEKRLKERINWYNKKANSIHKMTNKYKLPIYKLSLTSK